MLVLAGGRIIAQPPEATFISDAYGFSYRLPLDWQIAPRQPLQIAPQQPLLPAAKQNAEESAKNPGQELSVACAQVVFSARHGKPPSVVVVAALPFTCYGQAMTAKDLSGFAAGISEGLKQNFDISDPLYGAYTLGTHHFWAERAVGVTKNQPKSEYTVEIACTVLKKTAVCWMTLAGDASALRDFEHGVVTLDGDPPLMLVPIDAFEKKPL